MNEIGFVITSEGWGGLELNVLKLANWLKLKGWRITLFTVENTKTYHEAIRASIKIYTIEKHRKYFDIPAAYRFAKILKQTNISTIVAFDNKDLDFIFLTKKLFAGHLRFIYQQHMQIGLKKNDFLHTLRFSAIDTWISPLNFLKQEVKEKTKFDPDKVKVIPLGLEVEKFIHPKYTKEVAREKLNIPQSLTLVGILGRIDPKKGQLFLIKAIEKLLVNCKDIALLIVGAPTVNDRQCQEYNSQLITYIKEHQLNDKIFLRGPTGDVQMFYNAIDIFALATEGETYGMVTIEAMLSGVPVIATNSGGTPEILSFGELGSLFTPNDLDDFCTKLEAMLKNNEPTMKTALKAQQSAKERFSHIYEIEQVDELLKN